jgi:hypothetical protein
MTSAGPRNAIGTVGAIAMASPWRRGSRPTSRFSQPSLTSCGAAPPVSSTFWPSKWERSRYGEATAWTNSACFAS